MKNGKRAILTSAIAALLLTVAHGTVVAQAQKPPIKLGLITPLTGPLASYGKAQELVMKLAVEDVNAKGGINGSLLQLDIQDSSTDPGQAVLLFRKFAGEGYFAVLGPMTGTQWETVSPLANRIQMPAIAVNAVKPGITIRPWTIRLQPADAHVQFRRGGKSVGQMLKEEVNPVVGLVAMISVLTIMTILLAVLGLVVVNALAESPWGLFTIAATMPIAVVMGCGLRFGGHDGFPRLVLAARVTARGRHRRACGQ